MFIYLFLGYDEKQNTTEEEVVWILEKKNSFFLCNVFNTIEYFINLPRYRTYVGVENDSRQHKNINYGE